MDLSSFVLWFYEGETIHERRQMQEADVQLKSKVISAVLSITIQRDAFSRAHSLSGSYLVIFLLSTVCHFHDDGIRRQRIGGGKDDS